MVEVENGYRLPKKDTPDNIYGLLLKLWEADVAVRAKMDFVVFFFRSKVCRPYTYARCAILTPSVKKGGMQDG